MSVKRVVRVYDHVTLPPSEDLEKDHPSNFATYIGHDGTPVVTCKMIVTTYVEYEVDEGEGSLYRVKEIREFTKMVGLKRKRALFSRLKKWQIERYDDERS